LIDCQLEHRRSPIHLSTGRLIPFLLGGGGSGNGHAGSDAVGISLVSLGWYHHLKTSGHATVLQVREYICMCAYMYMGGGGGL
jgi:hypothetical protein